MSVAVRPLVRPFVSAGLALATVGVMAAAPTTAPQTRLATDPVSLTAASGSLANVPANIVNAILNIPSAELAGVQRLTAAMYTSQNWFIYSPVNVLGADPSNPEMVKGGVDMLIPFPALSHSLGDQLNWWFMANFPMNAGCTGFPPCPDLNSLLNVMFKVPGPAFYSLDGYTFAEPLTPTNNPVSDQEGQWNADLGQTGVPVPWYADNVKLDQFDSLKSVWNYLTGTPGKVVIPTVNEIVKTYGDFAKSLWNSWNPFVPQGVLWNPYYSVSAFILRPFAKALCPSCNPYDPFMPVGWVPGGWVPDNFTYVPTSPYNPFKHYAVSHGPVPVEYDFTYKIQPIEPGAAATAGQQNPEQPDSPVAANPVSQSPVSQGPVAQAPVPRAASVRANRSRVQPATATSVTGEQSNTSADTAPAISAGTAPAPASPRATRAAAAARTSHDVTTSSRTAE